MVLEAPRSEAGVTLARKAAQRARPSRRRRRHVHGHRRRPQAMAVIEVNSNPSIRLLEQSNRGDLILKIWRHTFRRWGCWVFDLPKYGDGVCLARLADLLDAVGGGSGMAAAHFGSGDGIERQGQHRGVCAGIGHAYGLRTGLFTSPHLFEFNERFRSTGADRR